MKNQAKKNLTGSIPSRGRTGSFFARSLSWGRAANPARAGLRPAGTALAVAAACLGASNAFAQPAGAQAILGQAQLQQQGSSLLVTTQNAAGTNRSVINWQSFSVPAGSTTRFDQPDAQSLSINRVTGNNPSAIFGTLSSNGRLVLVNPSGIAVGAGAVVDTAGFTASTLRMTEADALAGRLVFGGDGLGGGPLKVDGRIIARAGDVVLIAPDVQVGSQALVQAPNGATVLAAGQKVALTGRGLEGIVLQVQAPTDQAVNLGTLQGDAVGIFAAQLKHSGLIQATAVSAEGGKVLLRAAGDNIVDGQIKAVNGDKGGSVDVLGQRVGLMAGAAIDASGAAGGGKVRIGGDLHGANPDVPNAQRTYVDAQASIHADATDNGDGGKVVVWADDQTQGFGSISARGGAQGGDGGFVEVSGRRTLQFAASVDTRAPHGKTGTLLLDPDDIEIVLTGGTSTTTSIPFDDYTGGSTTTIDIATINGATTNVDLQAINDIRFSAPVFMDHDGIGLSARAGRTITVDAPITTRGGAITLIAADPSQNGSEGSLYVNASLDTTGGGTVAAGADITLKSRLSDFPGTSVWINAPKIDGGTAGVVDLSGQSIDILGTSIAGLRINASASDGDVWISNSTLASGAGGISLGTVGAGSSVHLVNSSSLTSGGTIDLQSDAGSVWIDSSSLTSAGGSIALKGGQVVASEGDGVRLWGASIDAGAGRIDIRGTTQGAYNSYGVGLYESNHLNAGSGTYITGDNKNTSLSYQGGGIYLGRGELTGSLTGSGALTLTGSSPDNGGVGVDINQARIDRNGSIVVAANGSPIGVYEATITTAGGDLSIAASGSNVGVSSSTFGTSGGNVSLTGDSAVNDGVSIYDTAIDAGDGAIRITGTTQGAYSNGVSIGGEVDLTAGGGTTVTGTNQSSSAGPWGGGIRLGCGECLMTLTGSGSLTLTGNAASEAYGVRFDYGIIDRTGELNITGTAPDGYGVDISHASISTGGHAASFRSPGSFVYLYDTSVDSAGGAVTISGQSIDLTDSSIEAGSGAVSIAADGGEVSLYSSTIASSGGAITMSGQGIVIWYSGISTTNAPVSITGAGDFVHIESSSIGSDGGAIRIVGGGPSTWYDGVAIIGGSSVHAGTGDVDIEGESQTGHGFYFDGSTRQPLTISGANIRIKGTTSLGSDTAAVSINSELISASSALSITAVGGDLEVYDSTLSAGAAGMALSAAGSGTGVRVGYSVLGTDNGKLTISANDFADVVFSSLTTNGGDIVIQGGQARAAASGAGVELAYVALDAGTGQIQITGTSQDEFAYGIAMRGPVSLTAGGGTTLTGTNTSTSISSGSGGGVYLPDDTSLVVSGPLTVNGSATASAGTGVYLPWTSLNSDSSVTINGSGGWIGVDMQGASIDAAGPLAISGNTVVLDYATITAGDIALQGGGTSQASNGVEIISSSIDAGTGALSVTGMTALGAGGSGVSVSASSLSGGMISLTSVGGDLSVSTDSIVHNTAAGSVMLQAIDGNIGAAAAPITVTGASAVYATTSGKGDIYLTSPDASFHVASLIGAGNASITGAGNPGTLQLDAASIFGSLDWSGFADATLGTGGGMISATGPITAAGNVALAGTLAPGGVGSVGSMTINGGNFTVLPNATLKFDLVDPTNHDQIIVNGGNAYFPTGTDGSNVVLTAATQPPDGMYTLVSATTSGTDNLPTVSGNVAGATMVFGSLKAQVTAPTPTPTPTPTPAPTPSPTPGPVAPVPPGASLVDTIAALLGGDHGAAQQVVAEMDSNPLTMFTALALEEEERQRGPGKDAVVDNTCTR